MKPISSLVIDTIEKIMMGRGYTMYSLNDENNKYIAMDKDYNVHAKFDISFNDNAFICHILIAHQSKLSLSYTANICWTENDKLKDFFNYIANSEY